MADLFDMRIGGAGWHLTSHLIAIAALFVACFAITGYITFRDDSVPPAALETDQSADDDLKVDNVTAKSLDVSGASALAGTLAVTGATTVGGTLRSKGLLSGALYNTVEVVTADNVITAAEAGTVYIINDADHTATLPTATEALIGSKFKFIVSTADATDIDIDGNDANQCLFGYVMMTKEAEKAVHFVQAAAGSNSKIQLDGTTTGGESGGTGDTAGPSELEFTCVAAAVTGTDTDCWFVTGTLHGSGTLATPFSA